VARPGGHQDSTYLARLIAQQEVSVLQVVPSLLRILVEETEFQNCRALRRVFCGGEVLPVEVQEHFFKRMTADLINLYGPTEACIDATSWTCQPNSGQRSLPIGHPIANAQVFVLDRHFNPVPIGVGGELYIGGDGLARGYLNSSEGTAEKFIPNPFSNEPGARLYKTGDRARCLPDGNIEFLGRIDQQIKIRGFRVELGEIEAALCQHPSIAQAVALARENAQGEKSLVAYVVSEREPPPTTFELCNFLKQELPHYMIPSSFVFLASLPLTPNGKVDRKALPALDQSQSELQASYVVPRNPVEKVLAGIWAELLKLERVGIHDNFFGLGGHSLLATQIVSRVREALCLELPLRVLFEKPTVAGLASAIMQSKMKENGSEDVAAILSDVEALTDTEAKESLSEV
jgi:acyl-coenzyme A synthetase/AMP-(fatty) acid ligase